MDTPTTPPPPAARIHGELNADEAARLTAAGLDPAAFAVLEQPIVQVGGQAQATAQGPVMVFTLVTVVPSAFLDLPTSRILAADGQGAAPEKLRAGLPAACPPVARIVVRRDLLAPPVRAHLTLADAANGAPVQA
jgi:hypothetical protein